jgi:hypothetical protein
MFDLIDCGMGAVGVWITVNPTLSYDSSTEGVFRVSDKGLLRAVRPFIQNIFSYYLIPRYCHGATKQNKSPLYYICGFHSLCANILGGI